MASPGRPNRVAEAVSREREARCFELRKTGATFATIGSQLGITESGAQRAFRRALRRYPPQDGVDEARALEAVRLDAMQEGVWPRAASGEEKAIDRVLAIMKRRAELFGLDTPVPLTVLLLQKLEREVAAMSDADLLAILGYDAEPDSEPEGLSPADR